MLLQTGQLLSSAGSQATAIAYPLLALALTHSAVKAGLVSFARTLPLAVLSIPAGVAADHFNRRTLMIIADAVRAAAIGTLAVSLVAFDPPFWIIPCIAFVEGAGTAIFGAAQPGAVRAVVPTEQLPEAAGAQSGRAGGPRHRPADRRNALRSGPLPALRGRRRLLRVLDHLAALHAGAFPRGARAPRRQHPRTGAEGMQFIWHQPFVRVTCFLYGLLNFTAPGLLFCLVVIGQGQGLRGGALGLLTAVFAVSVLLGSFVSPSLRKVLSVRAVLLLEIWCWTAWPVPGLALGVRAGRRPGPCRSRHPVHGFGGQRLPHRHHPGPPSRPLGVGA